MSSNKFCDKMIQYQHSMRTNLTSYSSHIRSIFLIICWIKCCIPNPILPPPVVGRWRQSCFIYLVCVLVHWHIRLISGTLIPGGAWLEGFRAFVWLVCSNRMTNSQFDFWEFSFLSILGVMSLSFCKGIF